LRVLGLEFKVRGCGLGVELGLGVGFDEARSLLAVFRAHQTGETKQTEAEPGTSLIRNSGILCPYSRTMHRALWWVLGRGRLLMSEVPLQDSAVDSPCSLQTWI